MKKIAFISIIVLMICSALTITVSNKNETFESNEYLSTSNTQDETALIKPVITTEYPDNYVEFIYDGTNYNIEYSISSDQDVYMYRKVNDQNVVVVNEFKEIGEYHVFLCADRTMTYDDADEIEVVVRVLPRTLISENSDSKTPYIQIINDSGYSLSANFNAYNVEKRIFRTAKKQINEILPFVEKVVSVINVSPQNDTKNLPSNTVLIKKPKDFEIAKNYRVFELKENGGIEEIDYIINAGYLAVGEIDADSILIVSCNKDNPYLWIWALIAFLSLIGMSTLIYLTAYRKIKFILNGNVIYTVRLPRRGSFTLADGLEKYEWFVDKGCFVKARSFSVKELSKKYYTKVL